MRHRFVCVVMLLFAAVAVHAQTFRGSINGTVTDQTGAAISGAAVKATDTGTGVVLTTVTTAEGQFSFQDLPAGTYQVAVTSAGFTPTTVDKIPVTAGAIYTLPVTMKVGQQATAVEVSAAAITVDTSSSTQSDTIPDEAVQNLPMNGRDFSQLIASAPGYAGYSVGGFGSLNGTRANQMNWQIDGTDNNDMWHNIPAVNQGGVSGIAGVVMPLDAIDEFSAQTQSNAEGGRNAGGTVNLTIKSGTNELHGTAYYYNRNEFYAAHSPFFVPTADFPKAPPLRNENYGFSAGAPIIKDKFFFFGAFEKQQYIFGLTGLSTEPSTAWVNQAVGVLNQYGVAVNPLSQTLLSTLWPSSILNLAATPNNYFATVPGTGYSLNGVVKLDYNLNAKNHFSVHWFAGEGSQTQPPGASLALATASSNLGYYFEVAPLHVQNYSAVLNSVFTERLTNQLLFGISYFNQVFHDSNNTFDEHALGLYTSPDATIHGNPIMGAPNIEIAGFDQVGITPPEGRSDPTGHLTDILSLVEGKHQFRFGGEVRQGRVDEFYHRRSLGSFSFDGTQGPWAGDTAVSSNVLALADYLAGYVSTSDIAVGDPERFVRVNSFDFFAQDNWQVTRNLNVNLGLRYDYMGPLYSTNQDLAVFIPGEGLKIQGNGINRIFPPDWNNFGPRLGFAYQPTSKNDLVVRGGFGVFYDQINMNPFLDYRGNGADGLQDNPIGPKPVDNYSLSNYTWQANQYIFPGSTSCPTLSGCGSSLYNVYSVNQNFRTPYYFNYSLNVERAFGNAVVWQVGYVGSLGRKSSVMLNLNQNGSYNGEYPNVGSIYQLNSMGNSNYNAMQSTLKIRSWHGVTGQLAFTWSHALDDVTEYRGVIPLDSFNLAQEYGSSDFDTRLNFTTFLTYDIPGSAHGPKWLSHGWQLSSLFSFHSGQPFNFDAGTQRPGLNIIGNPFAGVNNTFIPGVGEPYVNPAAFCVPGSSGCPGTTNPDGDLSRNLFVGPGFADVDLSVIKNISFGERLKLQLRAEMFNVFNRKNLASGAGSVGGNGYVADTIGDFNGAPGLGPGEPFNMQLVGKIIF